MNPGDEKRTRLGRRRLYSHLVNGTGRAEHVGELMRDHNPHTPRTSMREALVNIQSDPVARKLYIHL